MRFLAGASAFRLPSPLPSLPRAKTRCLPTSVPGLTCRAAASGDGAARKPWLFVGLGNPGKVGFEMIDVIAEAEGICITSTQFKAMVGKDVVLAIPLSCWPNPKLLLNACGESVGQLVSYFKIPLNQVIVMYDDLDLPFAKLRLLLKGGHGGHNGMRSIINHLKQSRDFPRRWHWMATWEDGSCKTVLRPFTRNELEELDFALHKGLEAVRIMVSEGFNKSATYVNTSQASEMLN